LARATLFLPRYRCFPAPRHTYHSVSVLGDLWARFRYIALLLLSAENSPTTRPRWSIFLHRHNQHVGCGCWRVCQQPQPGLRSRL